MTHQSLHNTPQVCPDPLRGSAGAMSMCSLSLCRIWPGGFILLGDLAQDVAVRKWPSKAGNHEWSRLVLNRFCPASPCAAFEGFTGNDTKSRTSFGPPHIALPIQNQRTGKASITRASTKVTFMETRTWSLPAWRTHRVTFTRDEVARSELTLRFPGLI